eukprot:UN03811
MAVNAISIILLFFLFFELCAFASGLDLQQFKENLKRPKGIIIGLICQYVLLPVLAFILVSTFPNEMEIEQRIGLLIISTMPGGTFSNAWCFIFGADLTLSVSMTTASSLTSVVFITINFLIYLPIIAKNTELEIDYFELILSALIIVSGVIIGLYIGYKNNVSNGSILKILQKILSWIAAIGIILIMIGSFYEALSSIAIFKEMSNFAIIAPLLLTVTAYFMALGMAKLFK